MPLRAKRALIILSCFFPVMLSAQKINTNNKIDRPFRDLIAKQKAVDAENGKKKSSPKMKHCQRPMADSAAIQYSCVIYTKKPAALRKMGIIVQSELPEFVTALATLRQMEKAAALKNVTFIGAPEYLNTHDQ